jgi:hypothetical protein
MPNLVLLLVALVASPADASVILSDAVFDESDWTSLELIDTSTSDSFVITAGQRLSGGNPDEYWRVLHTLNEAGPPGVKIRSGHVFQPGSYEPSTQGAVAGVQFDFEGFSLVGNTAGAMGYGALIEQDGMFFVSGFGQTLDGAGFEAFGGSVLSATDFAKVVGGTSVDTTMNPDFSASGGVMKFGFFASNGTFGTPSLNEGGIDNWRVEITQVPAPPMLALIASAAAGGLTLAPRRPTAAAVRRRPRP